MKLTYIENNVIYYLEVESEYIDQTDGKGKNDAVAFVMGQYSKDGHEIDAVVNSNIKDAIKFAKAILKLCDEIEK